MSAIYTPSTGGSPSVTAPAGTGFLKGAALSYDPNSRLNPCGLSAFNSSYTAASTVFGSPISQGNTAYVTPCMSSDVNPATGVAVLAYESSSGSGVAVVVTPAANGTSVTYGTPVVFDAGNIQQITTLFDPTSGKFIIVYYFGNGLQLRAIHGTVSGTTITFGSVFAIDSNTISSCSACYDPVNSQVIVGYGISTNNFYGRSIKVSGSTFTAGNVALLYAGSYQAITCSWHKSAEKVLFCYGDGSTFVNAIVGTLSGATISLGTPVAIVTAVVGHGSNLKSVYCDETNPYIYLHIENDSAKSLAVTGTVPSVIATGGTLATSPLALTYDSTNARVVTTYSVGSVYKIFTTKLVGVTMSSTTTLNYKTGTSSGAAFASSWNQLIGRLMLFDSGSSNPNYTMMVSGTNISRFIGFARSAASAENNAIADVVGSTNSGQTGLTPASQYYVQPDGTIGTTQGASGVYLGIALSATQILVKG